jgi:hypothetical protein
MTGNEIAWCRWEFGNWGLWGDEQKDNYIFHAKKKGMSYICFRNEYECKDEGKNFCKIIS